MAASPGFAPGPPVSETGALLPMPRGSWPAEPKRDRQRLVAREGIAPSISGCRPDVILFHHRAAHCVRIANERSPIADAQPVTWLSVIGHWVSAKGVVEPEGVAPSPRRSKSPVPVCCGFGSAKVVLAAGFAPALATFSTSCLCWLGYAGNGGMPWTCTTLPGFRGAHCLADRPGALVRLTLLQNGTPGRTPTCIADVRSVALW